MVEDKFEERLKKLEVAIKESCNRAAITASNQAIERFGYIVTWRNNKVIKLYKDGTIEDILHIQSMNQQSTTRSS